MQAEVSRSTHSTLGQISQRLCRDSGCCSQHRNERRSVELHVESTGVELAGSVQVWGGEELVADARWRTSTVQDEGRFGVGSGLKGGKVCTSVVAEVIWRLGQAEWTTANGQN